MINFTGLCPECSDKLNHHSKKREIKRIKKQHKAIRRKKSRDEHEDPAESPASLPSPSKVPEDVRDNDSMQSHSDPMEASSSREPEPRVNEVAHQQLEQIFWKKSTNEEEKSREQEFDEYLADLLL